MFSSSILNVLILTISTFTSAHPLTVKKDTCTTPSTFTVSNFGSFYPASGNSNPQVVSFEFGDSSTTSPTQCTITGPSVPGVFTACADPDITFYYGGTDGDSGYLNVTQTIAGCESAINGSVFVGTYCIPSEVPFGAGTNCETPSVSLTGEF